MNKVLYYIKKHLWRKRMSKVESADVIKFLNDKWKGVACPLCGGLEWSVSDRIFEMREYNGGNLVIGGANAMITPVIPVTCSNCGNTVLINALAAGVLKGR